MSALIHECSRASFSTGLDGKHPRFPAFLSKSEKAWEVFHTQTFHFPAFPRSSACTMVL